MKHYYFKVVVKLTSIGTCCKPPLKKKKKIRILFLLFGKKKRTDHSCFSYTTSKSASSYLLPFVRSRIRDGATLFIRISACQWFRNSECCSCVQFPCNGFRSYLLVLPSLVVLCILSQLAFTSVVLNFAAQYKWKQVIDAENMSDLIHIYICTFLPSYFQHCTIISAVFIISSDSKLELLNLVLMFCFHTLKYFPSSWCIPEL